ncbi:MAG TPA: retention module-containing protein, partial [Methylophilus sp.]|nr:retention module-containing protein [Methylophilus sp.]
MAVLGTVVAINGTTDAVNHVMVLTESGVKKSVRLNDTIQLGDTVITPPGVIVELQLVNGKVLPIFAEQIVKFTQEFADAVPSSSGDSAVDQATIQAVIKAINEGRDIGDVLEETAAGIDSGSTTSYGFDFVNLRRIVENLNPLAFQFEANRIETPEITFAVADPNQGVLPTSGAGPSTPPSVVVDIVDASLNVADSVSVVTFTFSEAPTGFTLADISAAGGTVSNLLPTGNPLVYTATFTANPGFEGVGSVSVTAGSYTNGVGTPGTGGSDTVGIDTAPPVPTISLDPNITADDTINLAESGQNIPVTGTVGGDAQVGDTVTLTVNGNTYTGLVQPGLTFSILVPGADLVADPDSLIDAAVTTTDAAGNSATATDTEGYSVNTGAPSVVVDIVDASLNVADSVSVVTFTFSEAPTGFTLADISAAGGTVSNLLPTGNPLVYTATFTANPGFEGVGSVSVTAGSYTNGVGTPGTGGSDTVGIDTAPPVPTISLDPNITADDTINLAESGQNIPVTGTVGGDAQVGDTVTLTVNGNTYTGLVQPGLTFSILVPGADLVADPDSLIDAAVTTTDAAGNSATATDTEGYIIDINSPVIAAQTFNYAENQVAGATVATVVATDNVAVTGYRFTATGTNTSADGFYQISNTGVITITAAGVASGANDFETAPNSRNYSVTALDAAGNSSAATITLNETDVDDAAPVIAAQTFNYAENQVAGA